MLTVGKERIVEGVNVVDISTASITQSTAVLLSEVDLALRFEIINSSADGALEQNSHIQLDPSALRRRKLQRKR